MMKERALYKYIKVWGYVSSIPFLLATGPVAGFFLGEYLKTRFNLQDFIIYIFIAVGAVASLNATVRIIILLKDTAKGP